MCLILNDKYPCCSSCPSIKELYKKRVKEKEAPAAHTRSARQEFQTPKGISARRAVSVNDAGHVIGQDHHRAKLSNHDVYLILELRDEGMAYSLIAAKFETSKATIADICKGRRRAQSAVGQKHLAPTKPRIRFRPARPDEFDECA